MGDDAGIGLRIDLHIHHHFAESVPLAVTLNGPIHIGKARPRATQATLTVGEAPQMTSVYVNVDTVNEVATVQFVDRVENVDAAQPEGSVVAFTSSNEAVATIAPSPENPLVGNITILDEGDTDIGATVSDADGNPLKDAEGNDWAPIASTSVHVDPGAAVGARLSVTGTETV